MRVTRGGEPVTLEPRAFDLLVHLSHRPGQLVDKETLIRDVWHGTAVTDNAITRVVAQVRRAIGDTAHEPRYIETVPTRGYRFIARVEAWDGTRPWAGSGASADPVPAVRAPVVDRAAGGPVVESWRRLALVVTASMLLVGGAAAGWLLTRASERVDPTLSAADLSFSAALPTQLTVSAGLDAFPAVSPDGTTVAYATDRTGRFEIVVKSLAPGGGERLLTADGQQNVQPAWSPDGRFVAFHARIPGGIWVVSSQGGTPRQVATTGSAPAWSRDGTMIAYQTGPLTDLGPAASAVMPPSTIAIVPARGGESRPLTQPGRPGGGHGRPVWAPDGARVLFMNTGPMTQELWAVASAGGEPHRVTRCESTCLDPFFGPDGHLYYSDARAARLWRTELDRSGEPRGPARSLTVPVGGTIRNVSVSADGKVAAFAALEIRSRLMSVAVDATGHPAGEAHIVADDRSRRNTWPAISPDGQRIAYIAGRGGAAPDVWMVNRDGSGAAQMTVDRRGEGGPMWSSDGSAIIFKTWREGRLALRAVDIATRREHDVMAIDPAALTGAGLLDLQGFTLRASRDGARLTFTSLVRGVPNVFLVDASTMAVRQLTDDREAVSFPVLSPKGDVVAAQLYRDGDTHLAVVPAAGGDMQQVTVKRGQTWVFDWAPDGAFICAATLRDGVWNVAAIATRSGVEQPLTREFSPRTYVRYPAWSPQGDFIVYERAEITGNIWTSELSGK